MIFAKNLEKGAGVGVWYGQAKGRRNLALLLFQFVSLSIADARTVRSARDRRGGNSWWGGLV